MSNAKQMATYDAREWVRNRGDSASAVSILKRHVGHFESRCATDRSLTGKARARYQRAFHRSVRKMAGVILRERVAKMTGQEIEEFWGRILQVAFEEP